MTQIKIQPSDPSGKNPGGEEETSAGQIQVPQIDALLDEIETVLETDAQTFVAGFVQKGGE